MKAISEWQPWASLIVCGIKRFETRSWHTPYRGILLIHAAQETVYPGRFFNIPAIKSGLQAAGYQTYHDLPFGALIGAVRVKGMTRTDVLHPVLIAQKSPELILGDFGNGRWAWELEVICKFTEPIPYRGQPGLFAVPKDKIPTNYGLDIT